MAPLSDERRWLVVVRSIPAHGKRARARSERLLVNLKKAGFSAAEVIDSRQAPRLFCCYIVVLASRHKDREAAMAQAKAVKKRGYRGITVRRGW